MFEHKVLDRCKAPLLYHECELIDLAPTWGKVCVHTRQ